MQKIAMVGVGQMGGPMARNLLKAGFDLTVCDRSDAAAEALVAAGAKRALTPAELAGQDVVILMVANSAQAEAVLLGASGLVEGISGGKGPVVVVMGTVAPDYLRELGPRLAAQGVALVDAPVSGGVTRAVEGSLAIMMAGDEALCEGLRPVMSAMGKNIFYVGEVGAGQVTKIINNLVGISIIAVSAEAYRIARDNGLDLARAMPVFDAGTGRNYMTGEAGAAQAAYAAWSETRPAFDNLVENILCKDIDLALHIGAGSGELPVSHAIRRALDQFGDDSYDTWRKLGGRD